MRYSNETAARWVLSCRRCGADLVRCPAEQVLALEIAIKPDFPNGGLKVQCPNCGKSFFYERHQLVYRPVRTLAAHA
jgi:hypothetical protein